MWLWLMCMPTPFHVLGPADAEWVRWSCVVAIFSCIWLPGSCMACLMVPWARLTPFRKSSIRFPCPHLLVETCKVVRHWLGKQWPPLVILPWKRCWMSWAALAWSLILFITCLSGHWLDWWLLVFRCGVFACTNPQAPIHNSVLLVLKPLFEKQEAYIGRVIAHGWHDSAHFFISCSSCTLRLDRFSSFSEVLMPGFWRLSISLPLSHVCLHGFCFLGCLAPKRYCPWQVRYMIWTLDPIIGM